MIDSHTHRYPPEIYSNPGKFSQRQGESHWLGLVEPSQGVKLQGWASREKMITDMDSASVKQAVLLGWYWENPDSCIQHNDWHYKWIRALWGWENAMRGFKDLRCAIQSG